MKSLMIYFALDEFVHQALQFVCEKVAITLVMMVNWATPVLTLLRSAG